MKILALFNIKGGVGKTTSAVNIAHAAGQAGLRTLLWDLDPQGCAGWYLGIDDNDLEQRAAKMLEGKLPTRELVMPTAHDNVWVVPADLSMRKLDILLQDQSAGKSYFKALLKPLQDDFDLVILDCAPALSRAAELVFAAADLVLVPLIPSPLSLRAYEQLKEFTAQKKYGDVKLLPFFTQVDRRRRLQNDVLDSRKKNFPEMLKTWIPYASALEQMGTHRAPVGQFAASSAPGLAYSVLWSEIRRALKQA